MTDARHQLFHHQPAASRLKDSLTDVPASVKMGLEVAESLPARAAEDWLCWLALNRLRTAVGRAKTAMMSYLDNARSVGGLRLRGATDDGPPPLLLSTGRGLHC